MRRQEIRVGDKVRLSGDMFIELLGEENSLLIEMGSHLELVEICDDETEYTVTHVSQHGNIMIKGYSYIIPWQLVTLVRKQKRTIRLIRK